MIAHIMAKIHSKRFVTTNKILTILESTKLDIDSAQENTPANDTLNLLSKIVR